MENDIALATQVGVTLSELDDSINEYTDIAERLVSTDSETARAALGVSRALLAYRETIRTKAEKEDIKPVKLSGRYLTAGCRRDLAGLFPDIDLNALSKAGSIIYRLGSDRKALALVLAIMIQTDMLKD